MSNITIELDEGIVFEFKDVIIQSIVQEKSLSTDESTWIDGLIHFTKREEEVNLGLDS